MVVRQADREIIVHRLVVEEVILDHIALVPQAEDEVGLLVMGINLHDVPKDWPAPDLNHWLGAEFSLLTQAGASPTAKNHDFHKGCL